MLRFKEKLNDMIEHEGKEDSRNTSNTNTVDIRACYKPSERVRIFFVNIRILRVLNRFRYFFSNFLNFVILLSL